MKLVRASLNTYSAMASQLLTTPDLEAKLGGLQGLTSRINISRLAVAIVHDYPSISTSQSNPEAKLWLLAHFIAMYHSQKHSEQESELLRALSLQLSACSVDIIGRVHGVNLSSNSPQIEEDEESSGMVGAQLDRCLPIFIGTQFTSLLNQEFITGLLKRFNM